MSQRCPEATELLAVISRAHPKAETPVGQDVDRQRVLGYLKWMMQWQHDEICADRHPFRALRDRGGEGEGRRRVAVLGEVVLWQPDDVVAKFLRPRNLLQAFIVEPRLCILRRIAEVIQQPNSKSIPSPQLRDPTQAPPASSG
jgi:hypothetical protein